MRGHIVPLLLAALVAGCTSRSLTPAPRDAATREALLLTAHESAPGRHCRIVDAGAALPNVAEVLDTAAVPEYLHQIGMAADTGYALLSLRYDSTGAVTRERLIEYTIPDSLAQSLRSVIASALLPRPAGSPLAARLRIDLGATPVYRLGKSEYCDPEVIAMPASPPSVPVEMVGRSTRPTGSGLRTEYRYEVDVSGAGDVLAVRFETPVPLQLLELFTARLKQQHWKPALDDGSPVEGRGKGAVSVVQTSVVRPAP